MVDVTKDAEVRALDAQDPDSAGAVRLAALLPPDETQLLYSIALHGRAELNLMSTVHFARETLPLMQARRWGRFLAITSMTVKQPVEGLILSNAIRSGVSGLIKTLANEYGPYNVLVNSVCPGYTATARLLSLAARLGEKEGVDQADRGTMARQAPLGRVDGRRSRRRRRIPGERKGKLHHGCGAGGGWRHREGPA